jgi:2-keto-4-pentenoate hydratase/2-oxohepta-3-ene-1,7-dioic acid hydratase in catechol pathway
MRICRFDEGRIGIVAETGVRDVTDAVAPILAAQDGPGDPLVRALPSLGALPRNGLGRAPVRELAEVRLLSPVRSPTKIVAAPVNYRAHVAEANADPGIRYGHTRTDIGEAGLFLKANSALAGPGQGIPLRFPERRTDYEAELVVVIGREGSDIPPERALEHVAAYAVGLDITLRGPEDRSFRKSLDGYAVVGPWLTTADEVADPDALLLTLDLNGERRQAANTRDMVYGVARLIAFASSFYTLFPGDLLFTGTPEGVGPIRPGDRLVAAVEGVGRLETIARAHVAPAHP